MKPIFTIAFLMTIISLCFIWDGNFMHAFEFKHDLFYLCMQLFLFLNPNSLNLSQKKHGKCRQAGLAQSIDKQLFTQNP